MNVFQKFLFSSVRNNISDVNYDFSWHNDKFNEFLAFFFFVLTFFLYNKKFEQSKSGVNFSILDIGLIAVIKLMEYDFNVWCLFQLVSVSVFLFVFMWGQLDRMAKQYHHDLVHLTRSKRTIISYKSLPNNNNNNN